MRGFLLEPMSARENIKWRWATSCWSTILGLQKSTKVGHVKASQKYIKSNQLLVKWNFFPDSTERHYIGRSAQLSIRNLNVKMLCPVPYHLPHLKINSVNHWLRLYEENRSELSYTAMPHIIIRRIIISKYLCFPLLGKTQSQLCSFQYPVLLVGIADRVAVFLGHPSRPRHEERNAFTTEDRRGWSPASGQIRYLMII